MGSEYWLQFKNGKKEQLKDIKQGVRREQVDSEFYNIFDSYDINKDGTLEANELEVIARGFTRFAGSDKILTVGENNQAASIFARETGMNVNFQGFMKAISDASKDIVSTSETKTSDGGKIIVTKYADGLKETIALYANGDLKYKRYEMHEDTTTTSYRIDDDPKQEYSPKALEAKIKTAYNNYVKKINQGAKKPLKFEETQYVSIVNVPTYEEFRTAWFQEHRVSTFTSKSRIDIDDTQFSEFAKLDIQLRDFVLSHFVDTHKDTQKALDSMGILDDIGAAINAGAGELWNSCVNLYNKYFGDGTQEDYQNFYELVKKFEPNYNKALQVSGSLDVMRKHAEMYFGGTEKYLPNYSLQTAGAFQQKVEQYQSAQVLAQRTNLLERALTCVRNASAYSAAASSSISGYGPSAITNNAFDELSKANSFLLQYFNNDQEAVDAIIDFDILSDATRASKKIQELLDETNRMNTAILDGKTIEQVRDEYTAMYKDIYGVDFVPDVLDEKVMDAKATGGLVKIGIITIVSILITKSPVMANVMGAAAGSEAATGASAAFIRTLVSKYGATAVQQGIRFAMTTGTLATDVGLTLINQVTDNREDIQWDEVGESAASAAKYIYFGAYVGSPLAQAVASKIKNIGLATKLMEGGTKTTTGAITTTTIDGEKLLANFLGNGKSLAAKASNLAAGAGALATEITAFAGLELATGDIDPSMAFEESTKMQLELKAMHSFFEFLLGGKAHTAMQKAKMEAAIEKSGVKEWNVKEIKTPQGTQYVIEKGGIPIGRCEDINMLASLMMGRVSMTLKEIDEVREEGVHEEVLPTFEELSKALDEATTREDFIAIREQLKKMPAGEEKTALGAKYTTKWQEHANRIPNNLRANLPADEAARVSAEIEEEIRQDEVQSNSPIKAIVLTPANCEEIFKTVGFTEQDIARMDLESSATQKIANLFNFLIKTHPDNIKEATHGDLMEALSHVTQTIKEGGCKFAEYLSDENIELLKEYLIYDENINNSIVELSNYNIPEMYRMAKHYYEVTGEKFELDDFLNGNRNFTGEDAQYATNEQLDIGIKLAESGIWDDTPYMVLLHSSDITATKEEINDAFIQRMKTLEARAAAAGFEFSSYKYDLNRETMDLINKIMEYDEKSPLDFSEFRDIQEHKYIGLATFLTYLELSENPKVSDYVKLAIISEISSGMGNNNIASQRELIKYFVDNELLSTNVAENSAYLQMLKTVNSNNIELGKKLLMDSSFPNDRIAGIMSTFASEPGWKYSLVKENPENAISQQQAILAKVAFAEKLCLDKTINCSPDLIKPILGKYIIGTEDTIVAMIKNGQLEENPELLKYESDCWVNILKRDLLNYEIQIPGLRDREKVRLIENYARAEDDNIAQLHLQLINDAIANKDLLKSGLEDITDREIYSIVGSKIATKTLDLIGLGNTEAAFPLMLEEFDAFTQEIGGIKLSSENRERLLQKINPQNSQKAKALNEEITSLKKALNRLVGEENLAKIRALQEQKAAIEEQVKQLKQSEDANSPEVKQQIKELQKQAKALGGQAQAIYYQGENAAQVREMMTQISTKTRALKDYLAEATGLEPQEVVTKMRVLSALTEISTEEEMTAFIDMLKPSTLENEAVWNDAVNKKIFQKLGVEYDEQLSQKLDLIHCKYISKLFISSESFFENMRILVNTIKDHPELSVEEAIDLLPQNLETKQIFESLGFDFEKFTKVDKNSFTSVRIELDAEKAKQAAIHNLEEDLNDALFQMLPKEVTEPIFKHLEERLGVTFVASQKDNWVGDGFSAGSSDYFRLYKDGKPITFEDMDAIVSLIKKEVLSNSFWTTKQWDSNIENARGTMYTHLIKMRTQEVDNATSIKEGETADIEVRKTDMYDIKKALGLGNDAQCCTALGRNFNEWSAPTYIMNKCIGAIELTDHGNFVGNTMIYLAYVDGVPALVLDNIELKTKYQNNDAIRDTFVEYAKKLCAEIGQPDLPIFAGPNRHKLNMDIYPKAQHSMEIIGSSGSDEVYIDYDAGHHTVGSGEVAKIEMYKLR